MIKILFVCLGNICRSPAAEGAMTQMVKDRNLSDRISCDSSGTMALHAGSPADGRMKDAASRRGYNLTSVSRKLTVDDFEKFDYIITMDNHNYDDVVSHPKSMKNKVHKFVDFCKIHKVDAVPDPYYGGDKSFEYVMDIIEDGCAHLLDKVSKNTKNI